MAPPPSVRCYCSKWRLRKATGERNHRGGSLTGVGSHSVGACRVLGSVRNVYLSKKGRFD